MSPPETRSFFYTPLDRSRNEIRLVRIHAAPEHEAQISCSLSHVSLDDQPVYYALSYSWGGTHKSHTILLDGRDFGVTENLYEALREVRGWSRGVGLWIDQISLNQEDVVERNQEVLRMLDIYRGAAHVVVWLGTASKRTAYAMKTLKKLKLDRQIESSKKAADVVARWSMWAKCYFALLVILPVVTVWDITAYSRDSTSSFWLATRIGLTGRIFKLVSGGRSVGIPLWGLWARLINCFMYYLFFHRYWELWSRYRAVYERMLDPKEVAVEALKDFFARDWFTRIWIVQEICVARKATVLCGSHALEWEVIVQALLQMRKQVWRSKSRHPYLDTDFEFALIIATTYTKMQSTEEYDTISLPYLLSRFCFNKATHAHDKAYGLLGLCPEVQQQTGKDVMLKPRYDQPIEYAFADVVRFSIESTQYLDILCACTGHRRSPDMPSWVPDWTIAEPKDNNAAAKWEAGHVNWEEGHVKWEEGYVLPESTDPPLPIAKFSADLKSLYIRGMIVGQITNNREDSIMSNTRTGEILDPLGTQFILGGFNFAYIMPLIILFTRGPVMRWFFKIAAKSIVMKYTNTSLDECEEVIEFLVTEFSDMQHPAGSGLWGATKELWFSEYPMTMDVPRSAERMSDVESWIRRCTWEAVEELGLHPLLSALTVVETSADTPQPGDLICMMLGSNIPFILRERDGFYELIGSGNIFIAARFVWKAAVKAYQEGNIELREFTIR